MDAEVGLCRGAAETVRASCTIESTISVFLKFDYHSECDKLLRHHADNIAHPLVAMAITRFDQIGTGARGTTWQ
jgi:hypothetical protein